jgi:ATP-dependent Clp protease ATP-binding subunit ClpA
MSFERFTDRARRVFMFANQEAIRLGHEYIGTEHLLLGLLREAEGIAAQVFKNLNIDPVLVENEVNSMLRVVPDKVILGKLPQTPRARQVVNDAIEEARRMGHNYVGTEHLLLGLILEPDGMAGTVLRSVGLTAEKVKAEIDRIVSREEPNALTPLAEVKGEMAHKECQIPLSLPETVIDAAVKAAVQAALEATTETVLSVLRARDQEWVCALKQCLSGCKRYDELKDKCNWTTPDSLRGLSLSL